ncbi:AI-2E family transporter [Hasllibacter sp. MH4015]|uniref:AI-2E family transporter n=1 Tax=Hasllibacter sp. MH4015 TaxID=2854029 RepID=UPI001CD30CF5|nr:AI-2E family transporter [Hasllibacter sp. MH4015]
MLFLLCAIAIGVAFDQAQSFFAPVLSAVVLGVVLAPGMDRLTGFGLHPALAALTILILFICSAASVFILTEPAISAAIAQGPVIWSEFEGLIDLLRGVVSGVQDIQDTVTEALTEDEGVEAAEAEVPVPTVMDALSYGPSLISGLLIFIGTFYFFLAGRADLYERVGRRIDSLDEAQLYNAEKRVSRYFLTIAFINGCFGILVALVMMLLGMPQPGLWGLGAFLLNFLLYLGPAVVALALLVVGTVTFDGVYAVLPMAMFVSMNMIEGQFVTPSLVGQRMALNPLFVFLSIVFWLWLWGPIGGLVAIPLLVWALFIVSDGTQDPNATPAEAES